MEIQSTFNEIQNPKQSNRYETNKKYYNSHKLQAHRLSLLFAVKTRGRIPTLSSVEKYSLKIEEIVEKWREYHTDDRGSGPPGMLRTFELFP